jgi:hypothetical protein
MHDDRVLIERRMSASCASGFDRRSTAADLADATRETDLLERPLGGDLALDAGGLELTVRPFQIVTLRFSHPGGEQQ